MTLDSSRPVLFIVTIDGSGFTASAPANGFIDPVKAEKYASIYTLTGTQATPTVTNGESIHISGVPITFVTGSTDLAGIIATINALTDSHHVIASASGSSELVLTNESYFEGNPISVTGSDAVLTELGYVSPVLSTIPGAFPSSLANGEAKARGNVRWKLVTEQLSRDSSPLFVSSVEMTGNDVDTQPSSISFTVAYSNIQYVYTYDELNNNAIIEGIPAIIRAVARALTVHEFINASVYDPTHDTTGNAKGTRIENLEIGALADLGDAEAAITVTVIADVR